VDETTAEIRRDAMRASSINKCMREAWREAQRTGVWEADQDEWKTHILGEHIAVQVGRKRLYETDHRRTWPLPEDWQCRVCEAMGVKTVNDGLMEICSTCLSESLWRDRTAIGKAWATSTDAADTDLKEELSWLEHLQPETPDYSSPDEATLATAMAPIARATRTWTTSRVVEPFVVVPPEGMTAAEAEEFQDSEMTSRIEEAKRETREHCQMLVACGIWQQGAEEQNLAFIRDDLPMREPEERLNDGSAMDARQEEFWTERQLQEEMRAGARTTV
jgi:hypothetical protein